MTTEHVSVPRDELLALVSELRSVFQVSGAYARGTNDASLDIADRIEQILNQSTESLVHDELDTDPKGSPECPICGLAFPHEHNGKEIGCYRYRQSIRHKRLWTVGDIGIYDNSTIRDEDGNLIARLHAEWARKVVDAHNSAVTDLANLSRATPSDGSPMECLSELMRGLEIPPAAAANMQPHGFYAIGRAIAEQAKQAGKTSAPRVVTDWIVASALHAVLGDSYDHLSGECLVDAKHSMRQVLESFATPLPAARVPDDYRKVTVDAVRVIVKCADEYRSAVRDVFALREDGKPYAERDTTKDSDAMWAFQRLNDAGVRLVECCARIQPALLAAAPQGG